jgi:hypothetical protein
MSHLDILLPFAIPPAEIARDLLRELKAPALAHLLSRAKSGTERESFEEFRRALPHETWLARQFGIESSSSPQVAPDLMRTLGLQAEAGTWFVLQPVHIHIARDHLVLTDQRQLRIADTEAKDLFSIAHNLFAEVGKSLLYGTPSTWFLRADDWAQLQTSTPDAAGGRNIDIWMPSGPGERDWRKVQNDVQMHWFTHSVNAERESRGEKTINSAWLWGGGTPGLAKEASYTEAFNLDGWAGAFAARVARHVHANSARAALSGSLRHGLAYLDTLVEPALSNDWGRWLVAMQALETDWFAPLLDALKAGTLSGLSLVLTDDTRLARFAVNRASLRKFWVSPSLAPLVS